jgi:secreted trypsin-like serine protease
MPTNSAPARPGPGPLVARAAPATRARMGVVAAGLLACLTALLVGLIPARAAAVAGGEPAAPADWPFVAAILGSDGEEFCGGTLIRARWVLTAAHCVVDDDRGRVLAPGELRVGTGSADLRLVRVGAVREVVPFPHYVSLPDGGAVHDVALVRLARPAVAPLGRLARSPAAGGQPPTAWLAGWGALDPAERRYPFQLRAGEMTVAPLARCRAEEGIAGVLCASERGSEEASACAGDSGGPLVDRREPVPVVIGVMSYGDRSCGRGLRSVFTDVAQHRRWIDRVVRSRSATASPASAASR